MDKGDYVLFGFFDFEFEQNLKLVEINFLLKSQVMEVI